MIDAVMNFFFILATHNVKSLNKLFSLTHGNKGARGAAKYCDGANAAHKILDVRE